MTVKRWDNIEILQAIDRHQERACGAAVYAVSGLQLMEELAGALVADEWLWRGFIQEVQIARDAGLLTFDLVAPGGAGAPSAVAEPHYYLQLIRNFALTVAGQDRARGRQVVHDLSDPAEDDGRPISKLILGRIAAAIRAEYSPEQIAIFLRESNLIPDRISLPDNVNHGDPMEVFACLEQQLGSEGRRVLRGFLGRWVEGGLLSGPTRELRVALVEQLGRQGWFVRDGRLVVDKPTSGLMASSPMLRDARIAALHPEIGSVAEQYVLDGYHAGAVFEAMKAVSNRVKKMASIDEDGQRLMGQVFADKGPRIALADLTTETGRNIQSGYRFMFMGGMQALRNPGAHEQHLEMDENEAFDQLAFASLLMRRLDSSSVL
ncbi:TIGR02391 family protein [Amycolatopsis balhimycina DSM 5908]|uniref:TIGR02391 family protein n=1 Tax=Amycolatopsis balhimycina DSM 5908 TaxID=1081091 RepID=A0A428VYH3_AMYBA|nr:TIGR02391 family protein [Amycolatopsis balhimycina]RSM35870.1 TIGR02391 family protein [Amycolatopsis balhimycina DSM 5908]